MHGMWGGSQRRCDPNTSVTNRLKAAEAATGSGTASGTTRLTFLGGACTDSVTNRLKAAEAATGSGTASGTTRLAFLGGDTAWPEADEGSCKARFIRNTATYARR